MSLSRSNPLQPGTKQLTRTPFRANPVNEPKPAKGPRQNKCKVCRDPFLAMSMSHIVCGPKCAQIHAETVRKAKERKQQRQDRAQDKIKREGMKTYPQLIRETQRAFNECVRLRDRLAGYPCISSGRPLDWSGNATDCGHYRSTGSAPHLRFNFDNAHAQSKYDNQYLAGAAVDYRIGLIARIGIGRVEALEANNTPRKWTHDELRAMKSGFQAMALKLKKELQNG